MDSFFHHFLRRSVLIVAVGLMAGMPAGARGRRGVVPVQCRAGGGPTRVYDSDALDVQPQFPGGDREMIRFINSTRRYPEVAYRQRIEGRVLCGFVINEDGSVGDVNVLCGVEESLDREAVRVISSMPKWKAGRVNNSAVATYFILPIHFRR